MKQEESFFNVSFCKCNDYTTCRCGKDKNVPILASKGTYTIERDFYLTKGMKNKWVLVKWTTRKQKKIQNRNNAKKLQ